MTQRRSYRAEDSHRLLSIMEEHRGRHNAIRSKQLARRLHLSTRVVRQIIADLIAGGHAIGASVDADLGGYFMVEDDQDLELALRILRSRAKKIQQREQQLCQAYRGEVTIASQPLLPSLEVP